MVLFIVKRMHVLFKKIRKQKMLKYKHVNIWKPRHLFKLKHASALLKKVLSLIVHKTWQMFMQWLVQTSAVKLETGVT